MRCPLVIWRPSLLLLCRWRWRWRHDCHCWSCWCWCRSSMRLRRAGRWSGDTRCCCFGPAPGPIGISGSGRAVLLLPVGGHRGRCGFCMRRSLEEVTRKTPPRGGLLKNAKLILEGDREARGDVRRCFTNKEQRQKEAKPREHKRCSVAVLGLPSRRQGPRSGRGRAAQYRPNPALQSRRGSWLKA